MVYSMQTNEVSCLFRAVTLTGRHTAWWVGGGTSSDGTGVAAAAAPREEWAAIYGALRVSSGGHAWGGLVVPLHGGGWGWGLHGLVGVGTEWLDGATGGLRSRLLLCLVLGNLFSHRLRDGQGGRGKAVLRRLFASYLLQLLS